MAYAITPSAKHSPLTRHYADLSGVDFGSLPSAVAVNRSPDASNVYKNYRATNGQAIETRPGRSEEVYTAFIRSARSVCCITAQRFRNG